MKTPSHNGEAAELVAVATAQLIKALGMYAENMQRSKTGASMAYCDMDFLAEAKIIEQWGDPK